MWPRSLFGLRPWRVPGAYTLVFLLLGWGTTRAQTCPGDCDDSGRVTVDELVRGVNIALGRVNLDLCEGLDADHDRAVRVNELVGAVARALGGCAAPVPTETPTIVSTTVPTASATPSPSPGVTASSTQTPSDGSIAIAEVVQ